MVAAGKCKRWHEGEGMTWTGEWKLNNKNKKENKQEILEIWVSDSDSESDSEWM